MWDGIARDYDLAQHHIKLLVAAGEVWDRYQQARAICAKEDGTIRATDILSVDSNGFTLMYDVVAVGGDIIWYIAFGN